MFVQVVVTNQVTSRRIACELPLEDDVEEPSDIASSSVQFEQYVTPALGNTWTHFVNTRLILQFADERNASKRQVSRFN